MVHCWRPVVSRKRRLLSRWLGSIVFVVVLHRLQTKYTVPSASVDLFPLILYRSSFGERRTVSFKSPGGKFRVSRKASSACSTRFGNRYATHQASSDQMSAQIVRSRRWRETCASRSWCTWPSEEVDSRAFRQQNDFWNTKCAVPNVEDLKYFRRVRSFRLQSPVRIVHSLQLPQRNARGKAAKQ